MAMRWVTFKTSKGNGREPFGYFEKSFQAVMSFRQQFLPVKHE